MSDNKGIRLTTPEFRVSFPNVFKAKAAFENQPAKFNVVMLFDKGTDISEIKKAARQAAKDEWGDKPPKNLKSPFKDGDEKDYDGYENTIFINATSNQKPGLVDGNCQAIIDENDFYAGCYARAIITVKAYNKPTSKGVTCYLQHIQKIRDGEPFSGRGKAEDAFDKIGGYDEDNYADSDSDLFD